MYASKRRQRNFKRVREAPKACAAANPSNPSKRHRERLNGELETVAQLLPYDQGTIGRLDKLSVLRLAVSYLQAKAHFQASLCHPPFSSHFLSFTHSYAYLPRPLAYPGVPTIADPRSGQGMIDPHEPDFETISMKSLGGFLLVLNHEGEVYYASENVEQYLGFHQSDLLHQPLCDLIHSEDRSDIRQQLDPTAALPQGYPTLESLAGSDQLHCLERNVNARFRCLLDNTCGFLRMDIRGKLLSLHGLPGIYSGKQVSAMGLVAVCTPFVPPNMSDQPTEDAILKTKHQLDGTLVSMDDKMHSILELSPTDLPISFYSLIHAEDALCMTEAHKEVIKNGSSGLLIYRLVSHKTHRVYYVQSSCRVFYKNTKPESIGLTHRLLNEVEGEMLLEKRSSLKAKLLSFDDSLLQSPRTLQSTAALPLPLQKEEDEEGDSPSSSLPPPSVPLALPSARLRKRSSPRQDEQPLLNHPLAHGKLEFWPQELPVSLPPMAPPLAHPELPPSLPPGWLPPEWHGEVYGYPPMHLPYPPGVPFHPLDPHMPLSLPEYAQWQNGVLVPELPPMEPLPPLKPHDFPFGDIQSDYPSVIAHTGSSSFQLTEVTNLLG